MELLITVYHWGSKVTWGSGRARPHVHVAPGLAFIASVVVPEQPEGLPEPQNTLKTQ